MEHKHKASANTYKNGCRHPDCRRAHTEHQRAYRHAQSDPSREVDRDQRIEWERIGRPK